MKRILVFLILSLAFVSLMRQTALAQQQIDESWESIRSRAYPKWFKDAKLGVFIHWGIYSVPAYCAPESYSEWFLRGLQVGAQSRIDFMKKYWGNDFTYNDFAPLWKAELFDANEWAEIFHKAGAKYIILVSKHHDGFCLWPSQYAKNWNSVEVGPKRDIVGEVANAVRAKGIKFGLYYSLPEWNNPLHRWYTDPNDSIYRYVNEHMIPQFKEVVGKYKPHVLFTDGEWFNHSDDWHARELISWYYNLVGPDAIVNDRWGHGSNIGFITPEYSSGGLKTDRPWAEVRGLGRSFGLNRNEKLDAYMSSKDLIHLFASAVGYGGGLVINVGPAADGKIPLLQQERIEDLGKWISINQEAIYGSKTWIRNSEEKEVTLERIDPKIDFDWVRNSPGYPVIEDKFTATWTGFIQPNYSETYHFSAKADDGIRLFIDGKSVLDQWDQAAEGTDSEAMREKLADQVQGNFSMEKGRKYQIKVEYQEKSHNASISLFWESPSTPKEVIPQSNLFTKIESPKGEGLNATYKSMRQHIAYTHNNGNLYVICFEWPGEKLELTISRPKKDTKINLLGREGALPWIYKNNTLIIDLKQVKYNEMPSHFAWTFRIEGYE
jgi:alpha-L-fucosidase